MDASLVSHFGESGHSETDFKYCAITKIEKPLISKLMKSGCMEGYWIFRLNTEISKGLNQSLGLSGFVLGFVCFFD